MNVGDLRTARLVLREPVEADLDDLHDLMSDPRVWQHFPEGRYTHISQTVAMLDRVTEGWPEHGQDHWVAREAATGAFVGIGGPDLRPLVRWNLYYRLGPEAQGRGLAQELIAAARDRAAALRPDLPVVASLLERNAASRRAAERAGLELRWRGPDPEAGEAVRLLFADRPFTAEQLGRLAR